MTTRVTLTFITRYGLTFVVRLHFPSSVVNPSDSIITNLVDLINTACSAKGISIELTRINPVTATPGTGATINEDRAVLVTPDSTGEKHLFKIPAPKVGASSIFKVDNTTLDLVDVAVSALSASLVTNGRGRTGDALTPITKGHRAGGKALSY